MRYEFHCVGVRVSGLLGGYAVQRVCKVPRSFEGTSRLHLQGCVVLSFRLQDLPTATYEGETLGYVKVRVTEDQNRLANEVL
jgi:hypothetical protein